MARYDFGGTLADFVITTRRLGGIDVLGLSAATLTFWSAQSGGTKYTDLQLNGSATSSIPVGSDGQVPTFQGPDTITAMWADGGAGRVRIVAQGIPGPAGTGATNTDIAGYVTTAGPTATALLTSFPTVLNAAGYGVKADGVTDDRPAVRAAVDAAVAAITATGRGITLYLPPGIIYFGTGENAGAGGGARSGIGLPPNLAARLTIRGAGRGTTVIKLSTSVENAFWLRRPYTNGSTPTTGDATAAAGDYSTFKNFTLEDFDIDGNNVVGNSHVLIGSIPYNGTQQPRQNYANITIRRVNGYNIPAQSTNTAGATRRFIALIGTHPTALEATQTSSRNITVEDVDVFGGGGCAEVTSYGATLVGGVNHYYDNIRFRHLRHVIATPPTVQGSETSFYICGTGFGDYCSIEDAYSENIGDDAVEIGAMQTVVLNRVTAKDPLLSLVTWRHTHAPQDINTQVFTMTDCRVDFTAAAASAITIGNAARAYILPLSDSGTSFGTLRIARAIHNSTGDSYAKSANQTPFIGMSLINFVAVEITDPIITFTNYTGGLGAGPTNFEPIQLRSSLAGAHYTLRNVVFKMSGFTAPTGGCLITLIRLNGQSATIDIDGVHTDLGTINLTGGGGSLQLATIGNASSTMRGRIRGWTHYQPASITGGGARGIAIGTGTNLTIEGEMLVSDCNFKRANFFVAGSEVQVAASNVNAVRCRNLTYITTPPPVAITVGASPFDYQNVSGMDEMVTVTGGTGISLGLADSYNSVAAVNAGVTSGAFVLRPAQHIKVTYTTAPTMMKLPLP